MIPDILSQINQLNSTIKSKGYFQLEEKEDIFQRVKKIMKDTKDLALLDPRNDKIRGALQLLAKNLKDFKGDASSLSSDITALVEKNFNFKNLPKELKKIVPKSPDSLKSMRRVDKESNLLSEEQMVEWINQNKKPLHELKLTNDNLLLFLQRHGSKLEYFELDALKQLRGEKPTIEDIFLFLEHCPNLKNLTIRNYELSHIDAKRLANNYPLTKLETLNLWGNNLKDDGAIAIANSPHLKNLKKLDLGGNKIGRFNSEGIKAIAANLRNLETLNLDANEVTGDQILEVDFSSLEKLKELSLCYTDISPEDAQRIKAEPHFKNLKVIYKRL